MCSHAFDHTLNNFALTNTFWAHGRLCSVGIWYERKQIEPKRLPSVPLSKADDSGRDVLSSKQEKGENSSV